MKSPLDARANRASWRVFHAGRVVVAATRSALGAHLVSEMLARDSASGQKPGEKPTNERTRKAIKHIIIGRLITGCMAVFALVINLGAQDKSGDKPPIPGT